MRRDVCYYDGACGMCQRTVRTLAAFDWCGRLSFEDMTRAADLPVELEVAMTGMPMLTRDGRVLVGYRAVRRALRQTPVGFVPALVMHVPGVAWLGERVYGRIARGRRRACAIGPSSVPARVDPGAAASGRVSP